MEVHADGNDHHDADDAHHGSHAHRSVAAIDAEAKDDGDHDEQQGHHSHAGIALRGCIVHSTSLGEGGAEGAGHNGGESGHDQDQGQISEGQEQHLGPLAHVLGDDLADGTAAVADRGEQSSKVMHAAEEHAADDDPQQAGQPAEAQLQSGDGAGDGAGARDG